MHDGRARSIFEAILRHDGEAQASRLSFEALTSDQRNDVLIFRNRTGRARHTSSATLTSIGFKLQFVGAALEALLSRALRRASMRIM